MEGQPRNKETYKNPLDAEPVAPEEGEIHTDVVEEVSNTQDNEATRKEWREKLGKLIDSIPEEPMV
ncbi:MAG: hypothetical protein Q8O94_02320 [bacterium]|nr:hypothetical protein [bacterium]